VTSTFLSHVTAGFYRHVAIEPAHFRLARDWVGGFTVALRSLNAIHVAVAATLGARLVTADRTLGAAAAKLGVASSVVRPD
jgi:hypothetical protein